MNRLGVRRTELLVLAGLTVQLAACGGSDPLPMGGSEMPGLENEADGRLRALHNPNRPPTLALATQPAAAPGDPFPVISGRAPLEVRFNLCRSSDPDQEPDDQPTSGEGDSLNWQFHFGDDGSSPWNPDGTFHANVGQMCRTSHVYQEGRYTATVSVTDKHLEDQGGQVARLARVTQQLTIDVVGSPAGAGGGGGAPATLCSSPALAIPDSLPTGVADTLSTSGGTLTDLDVSIVATHTWVGDLIFTLQHVDTGTTVIVFDRPGVPVSTFGCQQNDIATTLDDAAGTSVENVCVVGSPAIDAGPYAPNNPLAAFNGESLSGNWTMRVSDNALGDTGTLDQWCLVPSF
jgi:hypothetical protein